MSVIFSFTRRRRGRGVPLGVAGWRLAGRQVGGGGWSGGLVMGSGSGSAPAPAPGSIADCAMCLMVWVRVHGSGSWSCATTTKKQCAVDLARMGKISLHDSTRIRQKYLFACLLVLCYTKRKNSKTERDNLYAKNSQNSRSWTTCPKFRSRKGEQKHDTNNTCSTQPEKFRNRKGD